MLPLAPAKSAKICQFCGWVSHQLINYWHFWASPTLTFLEPCHEGGRYPDASNLVPILVCLKGKDSDIFGMFRLKSRCWGWTAVFLQGWINISSNKSKRESHQKWLIEIYYYYHTHCCYCYCYYYYILWTPKARKTNFMCPKNMG